MPKISVIVTSYNRPEWVYQAVGSVMTQTYRDFEVIVLDDNSPDPAMEGLLAIFERDPKITVVRSGVSEEDRYKTARYATLINLGVLEFSSGEYITYLTDDDFYYPHRLQAMMDVIDKYGAEIVYDNQQIVDVDGNLAGIRDTKGVLDEAFNVVDHNSVLHSRRVFDEVGGWRDDPGMWGGADAYFWRELNNAGHKFYPVEGPCGEAKRYSTTSIQWKIVDGSFFPS